MVRLKDLNEVLEGLEAEASGKSRAPREELSLLDLQTDRRVESSLPAPKP